MPERIVVVTPAPCRRGAHIAGSQTSGRGRRTLQAAQLQAELEAQHKGSRRAAAVGQQQGGSIWTGWQIPVL